MTKSLKELQSDLITANHILHYHKVVDAYGHVSVRHPEKPDIYIMSGSVAPALVESPDDLIEYHVKDSSPVNSNSRKGFIERYIHGEIFKRYPGINCVIHSHSEAVLPFTVSGVPLVPVFHMAGFLGGHVPVFDIAELYEETDARNMLVSNVGFGAALALKFSEGKQEARESSTLPDHSVVLMKKHGFTTLGSSIQQATFCALYTQTNAGIQMNAMLLKNSGYPKPGSAIEQDPTSVNYLSGKEALDCQKFNEETQERPWGLWLREVEACPLYVNRLSRETS